MPRSLIGPLVIWSAIVVAGSLAVAADGPTIAAPYGREATIDGVIGEDEWRGAWRTTLSNGVQLRLMHDGRRLFVGLSDLPGPAGWACAFIARPDRARITVLHASAQLGSAIYEPAGRDRGWSPRSTTYAWKEADVLMREEGWMANVSSNGAAKVREFAINLDLLALSQGDGSTSAVRVPGGRLAIAYASVTMPGAVRGLVSWPASVQDAVRNQGLVDGWNPGGLTFDSDTWAVLTRQPVPAARP